MVDIPAQIAAVSRGVRADTIDGAECRVQTLTQRYPSPLEDVWEAITVAERIARWFLPVEGDLRLGGRYQLIGNAGGTVLECSTPDADAAGYRVTWEFGGAVSWVAVGLRAVQPGSTELTLTHVARVADTPPGFWELYGPGATGVGWDSGLLGLALHLAHSTEIRPEDADAWMATEEGRDFLRRCADAWARAQVEAGDDPAAAAHAADGTYAFYTGEAPV